MYCKMIFWICEFCEKWNFETVHFVKKRDSENVNFAKYEILKKCEFCQKWDFENVNFVKNEILKLWVLWKMRFSKCEFLNKLRVFAPVWFLNSKSYQACCKFSSLVKFGKSQK